MTVTDSLVGTAIAIVFWIMGRYFEGSLFREGSLTLTPTNPVNSTNPTKPSEQRTFGISHSCQCFVLAVNVKPIVCDAGMQVQGQR